MSSRSDPSALIALSDLHLSSGDDRGGSEPGESFFNDDALVELLSAMTESAESVQLLLLGDSFELPGGVIDGRRWRHCLEVSVDELRARLRRIAAAHSAVFAALSRYVAAGGRIHVVPGNHDPALHIPQVFDDLRALICSGAAGDIVLHPGVFRIDGVLHAEHGNRLHDINAFVNLAAPYASGPTADIVRLEDPIGSSLHRARKRGLSAKAVFESGWDLGQAAAWGVRHRHSHASRADATLEAVAPTVPIGVVPAIRRVARRLVGRTGTRRDDYMRDGVVRTHAALARHQLGAPMYLFGHSHRSADEHIGGIRYLNTGSWSRWGDHVGTDKLPWVLIEWGRGAPSAELHSWPLSGGVDHQLGRIRSLA